MNPFVDVENIETETTPVESNVYSAYGAIAIGNGTNVFRADQSGIWLGAKEFATAPFKVDMLGNVTMTTATITGYVASGGAAADVNASVTTINADRINISGSTTFASGYNPQDKVDEIGGNYVSTSEVSAAKVKIFPDANTGIVAYTSNGTSVVFKVEVGGTNVGDVTIGNYAGGNGALWDQSASKLYIKGDLVAGTLSANRLSGGTIDASDITITNITATNINTGTLNGSNVSVTNISASNITTGTLTVNGSGVSKIVASSSGYGDTGFYTWTSGSKLWNDSSGYLGMKATGERIYFYTGSVLYALFQRGAYASFYSGVATSGGGVIIGAADDAQNLDCYGWGSFRGDLDINSNKLVDCKGINWNTNSNQDGDGKMWFYTSGGNYYMRMDMGSRQQFDTHGV